MAQRHVVNKTGLPSFIVTLASFFVLRGAILVISKRLAGKVTVDGVDDADGYEFFRKVFASVHNRETFALRDPLFLVLCVGGAALICWSLLERGHSCAATRCTRRCRCSASASRPGSPG